MRHMLRWASIEGVGTEYLHVDVEQESITANGVVVGEADGEPFGLVYSVTLDAEWRTRSVEVWCPTDGHSFRLRSNGEGLWQDLSTGEHLQQLDGCIDVDIAATPFTNTLPIRRCLWTGGQRRTLSVAYMSVPELLAIKKEQRYTCIEEKKKFLFETIPADFEAELTIDADGFVMDYPGLFRRLP